ncbi:hypothetical protein GOP47_0013114 [Adiantum capillus-veneris]|uniref:Reverse transcriptase Ty1/copia-type domain-containing protein n=1 Tax=Adiantum capillus-veneris TaxID=13818 RepID=A0A9D4UTC3_ADICA|nr:hypothetical protein GOP47_0013114 [Adiantum capillus-veneris]
MFADFEPDYAYSALSSTPTVDPDDDPLTVRDALSSPDAAEWHAAMEDEVKSLKANKTWSLVPLPPGWSPITCKWVLRRKYHPDGSVARYKARLVARGFSQVEGLDYNETFSPVLRMASFRILLALAVLLDLELHHLDVQTAFLHGDLPEEIYMEQPPHFVSTEHPLYVCHLLRSLYGLKQSPRLWFQRFNKLMLSLGYTRLLSEPNIYIRHTQHSPLVVALYVDDIPLLGTKSEVIKAKSEIASAFSITDLGPLTYFLGLQVKRDRQLGTLLVHQSKFVQEIFKQFGMISLKPATTPLAATCKLSLADCPTTDRDKAYMQQFPYKQLIGKIRYLVTGIRLDLCHSINFLSRFMHNPGLMHWKALQRVVRYLRFTPTHGLLYPLSISSASQLLGWLV